MTNHIARAMDQHNVFVHPGNEPMEASRPSQFGPLEQVSANYPFSSRNGLTHEHTIIAIGSGQQASQRALSDMFVHSDCNIVFVRMCAHKTAAGPPLRWWWVRCGHNQITPRTCETPPGRARNP